MYVKIRLYAEQRAVCTPPGSQEPAQAAEQATEHNFEVVNMVSSDDDEDGSAVDEVTQWKPLEPLPVPAGTLVWVRGRREPLLSAERPSLGLSISCTYTWNQHTPSIQLSFHPLPGTRQGEIRQTSTVQVW